MISWLDQNQGFIMSILTFVYVVATIIITKANIRSALEVRLTREDSKKPKVITYFDVGETYPRVASFKILNYSNNPAFEVNIKLKPIIDFNNKELLTKSYLIQKPISLLAPNQTLKTAIGFLNELKNENGDYPKTNVLVNYKDEKGNEYFHDIILDLNQFKETIFSVRKGIHELTEQVEKINESLRKILK